MEAVYPDRLDELAAELARHYTVAKDEEKALAYLLRAGDHSRQLVALTDAIEFYRAALERMPESDKAERAETLDKLGSCQKAEGKCSQAIEQFRHAAAGWDQLGHAYDQARALKYLGQALAQSSDTEEAGDAFQQAYAIIETLVAQLEDAELKDSFLNSPLVRKIRAGLEA